MQSEVNISALIQQRQNKFIETRTIIESEVNKFLTSLESLDADIQETLHVKPGLRAKDCLPSLWADEFNMEQYQVELSRLNAYINATKTYASELNKEALACLQS